MDFCQEIVSAGETFNCCFRLSTPRSENTEPRLRHCAAIRAIERRQNVYGFPNDRLCSIKLTQGEQRVCLNPKRELKSPYIADASKDR
jgi:hypothetical protein